MSENPVAPQNLMRAALGAFCLFALLGACSSGTGIVRTGPHLPGKEPKPIRVSEPPPPVQIEAIPLRRNEDCFYRDGAWENDGSGWRWRKGEWILPPADCYYAPPQTSYEEFDVGTALVHRPGVWHPRGKDGKRCPKAKPCPAPLGND